jgi:hypothetical protein
LNARASERKTLQIYSFHSARILLSIKPQSDAIERERERRSRRYWDPIILQLLIIKSFAKLDKRQATEREERQNYWRLIISLGFRFISRDINCTLISLKAKAPTSRATAIYEAKRSFTRGAVIKLTAFSSPRSRGSPASEVESKTWQNCLAHEI